MKDIKKESRKAIKKYNINKGEKGSITILVLASLLFFLMFFMTMYAKNSSKISSQEKEIKEIEKVYNEDIGFRYNQKISDLDKPNKPKLSQGMIPIKFDETILKWIICSPDDNEWYDYQNKKWANIMLSDGKYKEIIQGTVVEDIELGSMFVWIPRYAYSIDKFETPLDGEGTTQNITNISFLVGTSNSDKEGNYYPRDYNIDEYKGKTHKTPKIVHPGFTFGGKELEGIWSAKFEASMAEKDENTPANNNVSNKTIKVLPNKQSWGYIKIGNMFETCLNMKNKETYKLNTSKVDTHMMKNIEWGAVTYLAVSQYGVTPTINNNVKNVDGKKQAYTAGGERMGSYRQNKSQSTTGNENGIYDLNGGAWEYVASYWDNQGINIEYSGKANNLSYFEGKKLNPQYEKYWDKYEVSQDEINASNDGLYNKDKSENPRRKRITDARYNLMKKIKGDGMFEVINTYSYFGKAENNSYLWFINDNDTNVNSGTSYYNNDVALIGHCWQSFLVRGGIWDLGTSTGVFCFRGNDGIEFINDGFRPVLVLV